ILDWLKIQSFVDPERIAFYGLSYGGKTAMRVPPLVKNYCLSICSADFNDWVWKNASTRSPYSYVWSGEYEIFEFDLGSTFNYAEMAALIAPRPFMVERGHFDGVAPDEGVVLAAAPARKTPVPESALSARGLEEALRNLHAPLAGTPSLSPALSMKKMSLPKDLAVDLVASEPVVRQPLYVTFDERGRMWV